MAYMRKANRKDIPTVSNVLEASWKSAYRGLVSDEYLDSISGNH